MSKSEGGLAGASLAAQVRPKPKQKRHALARRFCFFHSIGPAYFLAYQSEFNAVNDCHFSGKSSRAKIAVTGHTGTHAPQSMHSTGLMYSCVTPACSGSSLRGWMQSTGHTSTQAVSLVPIHGSAIT